MFRFKSLYKGMKEYLSNINSQNYQDKNIDKFRYASLLQELE